MKPLRNRSALRGFTLIEILMVSVIMAVILGAILVTFVSGQASYMSMDSSIQVQEEARRAFDAMVREIREAGSVTPTTTVNGKPALDFQVALGYNLTLTGCNPNAICWGAVDGTGQLKPNYRMQYRLETIATGRAQLVREVLDAGGAPLSPAMKRVLSTLVFDPPPNPPFAVSGGVVTIALPFKAPQNPLVPGSISAQPVTLTTQVELRNPSS